MPDASLTTLNPPERLLSVISDLSGRSIGQMAHKCLNARVPARVIIMPHKLLNALRPRAPRRRTTRASHAEEALRSARSRRRDDPIPLAQVLGHEEMVEGRHRHRRAVALGVDELASRLFIIPIRTAVLNPYP